MTTTASLLEIRDLTVEYHRGHRKPPLTALRDACLTVAAAETVALVGESGSGKSTLLKLLLGFYAPTEGRVLIDGVDMRDFELSSLRAGTGVVSQEAFVFNATLRDNIAVGRPEAALEDVMEAARAAGLEEFIAGLPERYETVIGERGANMSGGQRQRLAIGRALVRGAPILLLDEATSALDAENERLVQQALADAMQGRTTLVIAHRLATVLAADRIVVMEAGKVVETGTHAELIGRGGLYARLAELQFGLQAA